MGNLIYKEESYEIIGLCMEVHNELGPGFLEEVYKDALEREFTQHAIPYEREKEYIVMYKGAPLKKKYYADFVVFGTIILEIKAVKRMADKFIAQSINYLKVSENKLALLVNFGEESLNYKRIIR